MDGAYIKRKILCVICVRVNAWIGGQIRMDGAAMLTHPSLLSAGASVRILSGLARLESLVRREHVPAGVPGPVGCPHRVYT